jgi:hypothetical protein
VQFRNKMGDLDHKERKKILPSRRPCITYRAANLLLFLVTPRPSRLLEYYSFADVRNENNKERTEETQRGCTMAYSIDVKMFVFSFVAVSAKEVI